MAPILIALISVLPLTVAGLSLLFVSGNQARPNLTRRAVDVPNFK
jgi:hypothetical protein